MRWRYTFANHNRYYSMKNKIIICLLAFFLQVFPFSITFVNAETNNFVLSGSVINKQDQEKLSFASIVVMQGGKFVTGTTSDLEGNFKLNKLRPGEYQLKVSFVGFSTSIVTVQLHADKQLNLLITPESYSLKEVVITASEKKGLTSASVIDRAAMDHLQPTSFSDLLSLLPGGRTSTPQMGSANTIRLREVGVSSSDYNISSLGVKFMVDGATLNTDANMQQLDNSYQGDADTRVNHVSAGVDMRTISTDNIEKVEIIRGIPSVKYGDLTSGLVKITRKSARTPLEARFKADQYGKLLSAGKGFFSEERNLGVNVDGGFSISKTDPRDPYKKYNRINFSGRVKKGWMFEDDRTLQWRVNTDYSGSVDNVKYDPQIQKNKDDRYKSSYHRISLHNAFTFDNGKDKLLQKLRFSNSLSLSLDKLDITELVSVDRDAIAPVYDQEGVFDAVFLPSKYTARQQVDGKPFYSTTNLDAELRFHFGSVKHTVSVGGEWQYNKNFGDGQIYDLMRPLHAGSSHRPRAYKDIPATSILSFYAEEMAKVYFGEHKLSAMLGIRTASMLNLDKQYAMHGRMYVDPRLNIDWSFPAINDFHFSVSGGVGRMNKMPTIDILNPDKLYIDLTQFNYWHPDPSFKRINLRTYIIDRNNYDVEPAHNTKWELRANAEYHQHKLTVTYFQEKMDDGFRYISHVQPFAYRKYDGSGIDASQLVGPPSLEGLPYVDDKVMRMYGMQENGSSIEKKGIEFQYSSPRVKAINTRFTVNGAWFHTVYENSRPEFHAVSKVIGQVPVSDKYIGLYDWKDSYERSEFSSNFIVDTYLENLGVIFSGTAECFWTGKYSSPAMDGRPIAYMDTEGMMHPYTEQDELDLMKSHLNLTDYRSGDLSEKKHFYMCTNFKVTKKFGKYIVLSFFADKILNIAPDYEVNGFVIRRSFRPYFGMELNLKL